MAVDTLGHLLALHVTPANADDRAQVERLAKAVQAATDDSVEIAFVDQGYTGEKPATAARKHGIELEVVKLPEAKRGFVLLPRRWVVERSFAWATRFRRLVKDYERYVSTLADLHIVAFVCLMLKKAALIAAGSQQPLARLKWSQVDFEGETIGVVGKGDKPHILPLTPELRALLEPLRGHHPTAVFTYVAQRTNTCGRSGKERVAGVRYPITYEGLGTRMQRTIRKAGVKDLRPMHDFRHTAATRTLRATGNLRLVQNLLAHSSPTTPAKYAHAMLDDLRAGMEATARRTQPHAKSHGGGKPELTP